MAPASSTTQLGLISMVLGIAAVATSLCCGFVALPLAIGAVVTGIIGVTQPSSQVREGRGQAIAGIACGAGAVVLQVALFILQIGLFAVGD